MAIPWLIGGAIAAAVAAAAAISNSDSSSSSSSDDEERAKRRSERERKQKENEQVVLQNIAKLEQAVDLLMNSYGIDEAEALRFLNPDEDCSGSMIPDELVRALDQVKNELMDVRTALSYLEDVEDEL